MAVCTDIPNIFYQKPSSSLMLFRTVQLNRTQVAVSSDESGLASFIDSLKSRLETIIHELLREKKQLQERFSDQKRALLEEMESKDSKIQKLQKSLHQLQQENQQMRYQYDQRVSLMNILKQQNWLISKEYAQEKQSARQTIDFLAAENQRLRHSLLRRHYADPPSPYTPTRSHPSPLPRQNNFYSMTDLHSNMLSTSPQLRHRLTQQQQPQSSEQENSMQQSGIKETMSRSSLAEMVKMKQTEYRDSRVTQIKETKSRYRGGLERMATKTHLSRQRTSGGRTNQ